MENRIAEISNGPIAGNESRALAVKARQNDYSFDELQAIAKLFADSGYFNDAMEVAQAFVKVQAGKELGIPPQASMREIYVVKGKVSLSAASIAALIRKSGIYDYRVIEHTDKVCKIQFLRKQSTGPRDWEWVEVGQSSFSMDDAKAADLIGNSTWKKFPRNMLFSRAMSNGAKWYTPDVTFGSVYTPDELDDTFELDEEGSYGKVKKVAIPRKAPSLKKPVELLEEVQKKPAEVIEDAQILSVKENNSEKNVETSPEAGMEKDATTPEIETLAKETSFDLKKWLKSQKVGSLSDLSTMDLNNLRNTLRLRKSNSQ